MYICTYGDYACAGTCTGPSVAKLVTRLLRCGYSLGDRLTGDGFKQMYPVYSACLHSSCITHQCIEGIVSGHMYMYIYSV